MRRRPKVAHSDRGGPQSNRKSGAGGSPSRQLRLGPARRAEPEAAATVENTEEGTVTVENAEGTVRPIDRKCGIDGCQWPCTVVGWAKLTDTQKYNHRSRHLAKHAAHKKESPGTPFVLHGRGKAPGSRRVSLAQR